ncbi:MAG: DNRLRE domain-containing protein [Verrucomicrobiota bacterium]
MMFTPTDDTFVTAGDSDDNGANFGSEEFMELGAFSIFFDAAILIRFDISSLPTGQNITNATLDLTARPGGTEYEEFDTFEINLIGSNWFEETVTANSSVSVLSGALFVDSGPNPSINLTSFVQDWYSGGTTNYGLLIDNQGSNSFGEFASKEHPTAQAPTLTVEFEPIPEPGALGLFGLGMGLIAFGRRRR